MSTDVPADQPVLLFDGVCNLCNRWIQFVIEHDPDAVFRFAPLQSDVAGDLLDECGFPRDHLDSVVLIEGDEYYTKSGAVLRTAKHLGGAYRLLWPLRVFPRPLRNWLYDFVADRRYGWFGKRDQCMMPTPDIEARFLAGGPGPSGQSAETEDESPDADDSGAVDHPTTDGTDETGPADS